MPYAVHGSSGNHARKPSSSKSDEANFVQIIYCVRKGTDSHRMASAFQRFNQTVDIRIFCALPNRNQLPKTKTAIIQYSHYTNSSTFSPARWCCSISYHYRFLLLQTVPLKTVGYFILIFHFLYRRKSTCLIRRSQSLFYF